jgi:EF-P beta-lysylation protein EpmB
MVPPLWLELIEPGNLDDPLLRQILPGAAELIATPGYSSDPVGEHGCGSVPGLLHKYHGRALLVATNACAIHCRYCFRREYPYETESGPGVWQQAITAIAEDPTCTEVLLSGGDPWSLPNNRLRSLVEALSDIPHLRRLRWHTRLPVTVPERCDQGLLEVLDLWSQSRAAAQQVIVVHCNHPRELAPTVLQGLARLRSTGSTLLNQSVLLKGVNDAASTLGALSETLHEHGILPYYVHQLDRVTGTAHFAVEDDQAVAILDELRQQLPGYLVPKLVREIAGEPSKTPLTPQPFTS